jgi:hypothetical protein
MNNVPNSGGAYATGAKASVVAAEGRDWLSIARESYQASTDYLDANWRKKWEDSVAMFQSRHPKDSKYNSDLYKHRSKGFRPKTRSVVRKNEAAAAAAFFANVDVVFVEPENDSDPMAVAAAAFQNELLNYRLTQTVPWFLTMMGAIQEAQVMGVVCSYQYWDYQDDPDGKPMFDAATGEVIQPKPLCDKPCVELVPMENIRFDPGADWLDVVKSSPYLIRMVPMYVVDVKSRMDSVDEKTGAPKWKKLDDGEIRQAQREIDTLRSQRENRREDPKVENHAPLGDFEIVWCHENFVRLDGKEVVYWTMGTHALLTEPKPLKSVYFTGERPFVIGTTVIEAHRAVPDSLVQLGAPLQREANDISNSRLDNVKLVLNKRWLVKRSTQVDVKSLQANAAGAVTMVDNPETDVKEINWPDVTASAYQEQDRINADYDELLGNYSSSSVNTNRKMNETVGGMNLAAGGASVLTEYLLRTFVETWVEPVLSQLMALEREYETDETILGIAGNRAELPNKHGITNMSDDLLNPAVVVRCSVGMGATDPRTKLQKFTLATQTYANILQLVPDMDKDIVRKEIYGLAGYKDGGRFFKKEQGDGSEQAAQQAVQAFQQQVQPVIQKLQQDLAAAQQKEQAEIRKIDAGTKIEQQKLAGDAAKTAEQLQAAEEKQAQDLEVSMAKIEAEYRFRRWEAEQRFIADIEIARINAAAKLKSDPAVAQINADASVEAAESVAEIQSGMDETSDE